MSAQIVNVMLAFTTRGWKPALWSHLCLPPICPSIRTTLLWSRATVLVPPRLLSLLLSLGRTELVRLWYVYLFCGVLPWVLIIITWKYNYGQPRIGDLNLVTYITNQGNNYRVTHTNDVIPRIIATSAGFRHISPEYWISHDVNSQFTVGTDQIDVLDGYNNLNGNGGTGGLGALAHVQYFQSNIGGCSSLLGWSANLAWFKSFSAG